MSDDDDAPRPLEPLSKPDWGFVRDRASQLLTESKDLWIASWLLDSLVRLHGLTGLRDGFRLIHLLSDRYWEHLHPREDVDTTPVDILTGLVNGALVEPIQRIPITDGSSPGPFTSTDFIDASDLENTQDPRRKAERIERGAVTLEMISAAAAKTSAAFFSTLLEQISEAKEQHEAMTSILNEKCGPAHAPPASGIRDLLDQFAERVRFIARDKLATTIGSETATSPDATGSQSSTDDPSQRPLPSGPIQTRDDAFRVLANVSDFFRRNEPNSPIVTKLEQVVRWGRMPWQELVEELIPDANVRSDVFRQTGIVSKRDGE
jgi:type VI secretion system protein ImpA